jgi:uncharacterized protein (TIRG00374 family)
MLRLELKISPPFRISVRKLIEYVASIAIVGWLLWYLWEQRQTIAQSLNLSTWHVVGISLGILLTWYLNGLQQRLLLKKAGVRISQKEAFLLIAATGLGNLLPMRVGTGLRLHYLKTLHAFRYIHSGSLAGVSMVLMIVSTGILGIAGIVGLLFGGQTVDWELTLVFIAMTVFALVILRLPLPQSQRSHKLLFRLWNDFSCDYKKMSSDPRITLKIILLMLMQYLCVAIRFYISFDAIGMSPSMWLYLVMAPVSVLATIASITPGGLGVREGVIAYIALAVGYQFENGLIVGAVDRIVLLSLTVLVGSVSITYVLTRIHRSAASNKMDV